MRDTGNCLRIQGERSNDSIGLLLGLVWTRKDRLRTQDEDRMFYRAYVGYMLDR